MVDPFGVILAILRADSGVQAIAGTRVSSEVSDTLPCVVLTDLTASRRPFGPGTGRLGMQWWVGVAKCYGADSPTGAIAARNLAGAVSDALHNHGPYSGSASRWMARSYAPEMDGMNRDPDTRWPEYDVAIDGYFAAGVVA
jgi:hypothetical protein